MLKAARCSFVAFFIIKEDDDHGDLSDDDLSYNQL